MVAWKSSAFRGTHFFESIASAEGLNVGDPAALFRIRDALTDAGVWLWQQHPWWWAVSPNSPARFEIFPQTTVVADSAAAATTLNVADTGEFQVGDTIFIDEGGTKEEIARVASITDAVSFTLEQDLINSHDADDAAIVRPLRPLVASPTVRTRVDASSAAGGVTLNVEHTQNFAAGDFLIVDPGGKLIAEELNRIDSVTGTSSGSFALLGNLDGTHTASNVYKATESCPKFDLTLVNGGVMADFGRATKVLVDGEGPLIPMNPAEWRRSREDSVEGGVSQGDRYIIEGSPPEIKFEVTPTSNVTLVVHYLRAPTRVFGDDDIQAPYEFHNLLRWLARAFLRKNGPAGAALSQDPDILAEINRLKGYDRDTSQPSGMRPMGGRLEPELDAAIPGAAVRSSRFEDLLN